MERPAATPAAVLQATIPVEDGNRHELIDGEHFVAPAPSWKHQQAVSKLNYFFVELLFRNPLGEVCPAPFEVVLSNQDIVQPDLLFILVQELSAAAGGVLETPLLSGLCIPLEKVFR